jgi:hypothetical protein
MEILATVKVDISKESLQEIENRKIEAKNKLNDDNLTFKEHYKLCIQAGFTPDETYQKIKDFIDKNIINGKYETVEMEENVFGIFEDEKLICRTYKIGNEYYTPPNSIQIQGLYKERD